MVRKLFISSVLTFTFNSVSHNSNWVRPGSCWYFVPSKIPSGQVGHTRGPRCDGMKLGLLAKGTTVLVSSPGTGCAYSANRKVASKRQPRFPRARPPEPLFSVSLRCAAVNDPSAQIGLPRQEKAPKSRSVPRFLADCEQDPALAYWAFPTTPSRSR